MIYIKLSILFPYVWRPREALEKNIKPPTDPHMIHGSSRQKMRNIAHYPLVNKHSHGKSPFLMGKSTISMAIFNSYVSLPEGIDSHVAEKSKTILVGG